MTEPDGLLFWDENNDPAFTTFLKQKERDYPYPVEKERVFAESTITETIDQRIEELEEDAEKPEIARNIVLSKIKELEKLKKEFKQGETE
jgi:predicted ribosome quality control (RQC) complex YloA/Tae2 family protein